MKAEPEKTVTRYCKTCGQETEQVRQKGNWYMCTICLWNADTEFKEKK